MILIIINGKMKRFTKGLGTFVTPFAVNKSFY